MFATQPARNLRREWRPVLAAASMLCITCSTAWGAVSVTINRSGNVFLKDSKTGKSTKLFTVKDAVSTEDYPSADYSNGFVYLIRQPGGKDIHDINPTHADQLWRYDTRGHGHKLWSGGCVDFRVREDGRMIAVLSSKAGTAYPTTLYLLAADGKLAKAYSEKDLAVTDFDFERWDGKYLWIRDQEEMDVYSFIRIETGSMHFKKYAVPSGLTAEDYDLNTAALRLAYSDYPVMFDTDTLHDFGKAKTPVALYVYNLKTKQKRHIAKSVAKPFEPKWADSTTLAFNNPKGKSRIRRHVSP